MKKLMAVILLVGSLIGGAIYLKSVEPVPPCDEYLEWCIWTWCPQNWPSGSGYQEVCRQLCVERYLQYCN